MSKTQSDSGRTDLYERGRPGQGVDWGVHHSFAPGVDPSEYIAFTLLYDDARMLCSRTLSGDPYQPLRAGFAWLDGDTSDVAHDPDAIHRELHAVELSPPAIHLPKQSDGDFRRVEYGQYPHRRRFNPETGYINWAESTSTQLDDVDTDRFLALVEEWLAACHADLRTGVREDAVDLARRHKKNPTLNDVEALSDVVEKVREYDGQSDGLFD